MQMSLNILIPKFTTEIKGQIHSKLATDGPIFLCPKKEKKEAKEALFRHDEIFVLYIKHCKGDGCVFKNVFNKELPHKAFGDSIYNVKSKNHHQNSFSELPSNSCLS